MTAAEEPAPRAPGPSRRGLLAASLTAGLALAGAGGWRWWQAPRRLTSGVGEIRRVPLGDGSVATLDTDSAIEVDFSTRERRLRLLRGSAFFEAVAEAARPFVVEAAGLVLRSAEAAFSVRELDGAATGIPASVSGSVPINVPVSVLVSAGEVALMAGPAMAAAPARRLLRGTRATLVAGEAQPLHIQTLAPDEVDRLLAWRGGMLAFEGETLAQAATMFARYGSPHIVVDDRALARRPITGLFAASDPAGFASAIALGLGARALPGDGVIHLVPER